MLEKYVNKNGNEIYFTSDGLGICEDCAKDIRKDDFFKFRKFISKYGVNVTTGFESLKSKSHTVDYFIIRVDDVWYHIELDKNEYSVDFKYIAKIVNDKTIEIKDQDEMTKYVMELLIKEKEGK